MPHGRTPTSTDPTIESVRLGELRGDSVTLTVTASVVSRRDVTFESLTALSFDTRPTPGQPCLSAEDCGNPALEICSPERRVCAEPECGEFLSCSDQLPVCMVQYRDSFWGAWKNYEGTNGAILTAQVMANVFRAKARKHPNALAAAT